MTMQRVFVVVGLAICLAWPVAATQKPVDPEVLFQTALYKEQVELKLDLAIAGYKDVVAAAGSNKDIAAKALLQMAGCYERLGKPEARTTYELIVSDYATVGAATTSARAKLAGMGQKGSGIVMREVWQQSGVSYYANGHTVSPDGQTLAYVDWNTGDIGVHDLASGRSRLLTSDALRTQTYAEDPVFSPDSRLIAYGLETDTDQPYELRVIDRNGGPPKVVRRATNPGDKLYVQGWHPGGQSILATQGPDGGGPRKDLVLVPLNGNPPTVIISKFTNVSRRFKISPDGRFVTYSERKDGVSDLTARSLVDGRVHKIHQHPANDDLLDWSLDGRVFFRSDRGGKWGIWSLEVRDGLGQGEPRLIRADTDVGSAGITRQGDLYVEEHVPQSEVYVATLDEGRRKLAQPLTRIESRFQGRKSQAAWSPSGDRLAYIELPVALPVGPATSQDLAIHSVGTGAVRSLSLPLRRAQNPVWLPDGKSIVVQGTDLQNMQGLFRVDLESGGLTTVASADPASRTSRRDKPALSPDGRSVYFSNPGGVGISPRIISRNLSTGTDQTIVNEESENFALSPSGEWLALTRRGAGPALDVFVIPSAGGAMRRLASFPSGWTAGFAVTWSHDGRVLFVAQRRAGGPEIWAIPIDGSAPWHTGITFAGHIDRISAHPDGHRLALSTVRLTAEISVLQNLPAVRGK